MSRQERNRRIAEMARRGESDPDIAAALGLSSRTVLRTRRDLGIESTWAPRRSAHGTDARYSSGCRCDQCTSANTERGRRQREDRRKRDVPDGVKHGLSAARNWSCRCPICRAAAREANRQLKERARSGRIKHVRGGTTASCPCKECKTANNRRRARRNAKSLDGATHHGEPWTIPQIEVAIRGDLTAREASKALGRTVAAVEGIRKKARLPKVQRVLHGPGAS